MVIKLIKLIKKIKVWLKAIKCSHRKTIENSTQKNVPMMIISYDDGNESDYTKAYPIHKQEGIVAEICIITNKIGEKGYLKKEQLMEMQHAGWEIVSHTRNHNPIDSSFLIRSAKKGDKKICVDNPHRFQKGAECIIGSGQHMEKVNVIKHEEGYLYLEQELRKPYRRYSEFKISEEQLFDEIVNSLMALRRIGINVQNFTFPYNAYSDRGIKVIKKYYNCARAGLILKSKSTIINKSIRNGFNRFFLYSINFEKNEMTKKQILKILDHVCKKRGVCIFHAHTNGAAFDTDKLKFIIEEAKNRKIQVVTRNMLL